MESYEIRLLKLHRNKENSIVSCSLKKVSLLNPGSYSFIYCWGDPDIRKPILASRRTIHVTVNLEAALRQLKDKHITRIWVDAVCINQDDRQERSIQVRNMKQIYSKAERVIAWLGEESENSSRVIKSMKDFGMMKITVK